MTRPDKHAARFGDRYRPRTNRPLSKVMASPRFARELRKALPAIHRMSETVRQVAEGMRRAREMDETARQVAAVINGPGERWTELGYMGEDGIRPTRRSRVWVAPVGTAAPTLAELEAGTPIRVSLHTSAELDDGQLVGPAYDTRYARSSHPVTWSTAVATITGPFPLEPSNSRSLLDRIDDTLLTYDAQRSTGQPWPFESF